MPIPTYTDENFQLAFADHLPTGAIWPRDTDSVVMQVSGALMKSYTVQAERAVNLLSDAFPLQPVELLPEWESTLGLPDPCAGPAPTLAARQQQVHARFIAQGGQSRQYFINIAAALGFVVTITEFRAFRFGDRFEGRLYDSAWSYAWQLDVPSSTASPVLQCEMLRIKPAHTVVLFNYIGTGDPAALGAFVLGVNAV